ncbi:MAG: hypothetical protein K2W95_35575 [Candidatus Obscuribacterales bacterium]|nr:hypothetical protein [Candidatus Obscuribacterales bacterium]
MPAPAKSVWIRQLLVSSLFILIATCAGAGVGAQDYKSWQSMETVMDSSDYPLTPDQDFALTAPAVVPPSARSGGAPGGQSRWYAPPSSSAVPDGAQAALDAATIHGAGTQGPPQAELQGQAIQSARNSHRHQSGLNHQQPYSLIYVVGNDGKPIALPYVVPYGAQSTQPVIIIQQAAPAAPVQQAPAAPVAASPPASAAPAATASAPGDGKQATWKTVVNSLAGNASVVPGNFGKGLSVAAPVLNAILQGL